METNKLMRSQLVNMKYYFNSPLLSAKATKTELYSLLFRCLTDHPVYGRPFREELSKFTSQDLQDPEIQRKIFAKIAGPHRDPARGGKSGSTYDYLPTYLADTAGEVDPRVFLHAIAEAAEHTARNREDCELAIHPLSLYYGVLAASVFHMFLKTKEYPRLFSLLGSLRGQGGVPFHKEKLLSIYGDEFEENMRVLTGLRVCRLMATGKFDFGPVYVLGAGLGRRGGVPYQKSPETKGSVHGSV